MTALAIAAFATPSGMRAALRELDRRQRHVVGIWSPVPFAHAAPGRATRPAIGWLMALAGGLAATLFYGFIAWSAVLYPVNSGGRPLYSWPAFLVAPIELGALVAAAAGVAVFLVRARLTRLHDAAFDLDLGDAMQDRLVLAVRCDPGEDAGTLIALLAGAGALTSRSVAA